MKRLVAASILFLLLQSCQKSKPALLPTAETRPAFITYTIEKNDHYSDRTNFQAFGKGELNFNVIFDSSAIYQTTSSINQSDINKLFGFSEGDDHQKNSARIGWGWNKNALRLYAYSYANGVRKFKEISTVQIGKEISCKILVSGNQYQFEAAGTTVTLDRFIQGAVVPGYMLYPYFGGDETAPHKITIRIMQIP
ncbi:MAG: hypothetical protein V4725_09290 [Bacteroidota bacterium]